MAATDRDIFIDIGISIAKLLLIASGQGAIAAAVGEGAGLLTRLRGMLENGGKRAVFAEKIADDAAKQLLGKHEGISEADWHVATRQVVSLIDRLSEKERLAAGYNCDELRRTLLDLGGTDLRSDLADESARHAFDWVLEVACRRISDCFTEKEALASLLEKVDEVRAGVQRLLDRPAGASQTDDVVNYHIKIVRDLAPDLLEDREQEIEELETFVRGSEDAWYALEASMVSGKTALMSSFALNPPDDVHIVSFFIRRIGGDGNDRESFALVMGAQLGNILGCEYIEDVSEGRRPVEFHKLLRQAATACRSSAVPQTLVLVIDGLDEDSYFEKSDGQDAKSILSMLPKCLPVGVKVITAARRNPRLPEDVQCDAKRKVVSLKPSPIAEKFIDIKEIEKFFRASTAVDIVAFLAACGDALTVKDLTKLLMMYRGRKILPHDVSMYVDRSPGRILDTVDVGDCNQEVVAYRVGHDFVMQAVIRMLDPDSFGEGDEAGDLRRLAVIRDNALAPYRLTIREWVKGCADRGWGYSTPSYVLSESCFDLMLTDKEDVLQSAQIVFHRGRYEELKRRSGSRSSVLRMIDREYFKVLEMNRGKLPENVMISLLGVAKLKGSLVRASVRLPGLLRLYVLCLGADPESVMDEVLSIDDPKCRLGELERVMKAAIECGRACDFMSLLSVVLESLVSCWALRDEIMCLLVDVVVWVGDAANCSKFGGLEDFRLRDWVNEIFVSVKMEGSFLSLCSSLKSVDEASENTPMVDALRLAADMAVRIEAPFKRAVALAKVASALVEVGDADKARRVAEKAARTVEQIEDPWERGRALAEVASALVGAGLTEKALALVEWIEDPWERGRALAEVASALVEVGDADKARRVAEKAARTAEQIEIPRERAMDLAKVASALVGAGLTEKALALVEQIEDPWERGRALAEVASALVEVGDADKARRVAEKAARTAEQIEIPRERAMDLAKVASALVGAGLTEKALALVEQIEDPWERGRALAEVASALVEVGDADKARRVAEKAARTAEQIEIPRERAMDLAKVASALVGAGLTEKAARTAEQIEDPRERAMALAKVASALVEVGDADKARRVAAKAARTAEQIEDPRERAMALAKVASALVEVGDADKARRVAEKAARTAEQVAQLGLRAAALAEVASALVEVGDADKARRVAEKAARTAEQIEDPLERAMALAKVASALVEVGDADKARRVAEKAARTAEQVAQLGLRAAALAKVASALVEVGDADKARPVAEKAARTAEQIENPLERAMALAKVASALVGAGLTEKALALVERIEAPRERAWDLAKVASALVEVGAIDEALKIVSAMNDPVSRSRALSLVIKALVRKGSSDDAVEVMRVEIAWGRGMAQRQEAAEYCAALAAVCVDSADFLADSADAEPAERDRWLSLACSGIAHSWLYGASVWDNFDELVRVAPELAVHLVDERILADPEQGTAPEPDPDLVPEGPGGDAGSYR